MDFYEVARVDLHNRKNPFEVHDLLFQDVVKLSAQKWELG